MRRNFSCFANSCGDLLPNNDIIHSRAAKSRVRLYPLRVVAAFGVGITRYAFIERFSISDAAFRPRRPRDRGLPKKTVTSCKTEKNFCRQPAILVLRGTSGPSPAPSAGSRIGLMAFDHATRHVEHRSPLPARARHPQRLRAPWRSWPGNAQQSLEEPRRVSVQGFRDSPALSGSRPAPAVYDAVERNWVDANSPRECELRAKP